eukprot:713698-Alexandrium_andersonii.AAC.1
MRLMGVFVELNQYTACSFNFGRSGLQGFVGCGQRGRVLAGFGLLPGHVLALPLLPQPSGLGVGFSLAG